MIVCKFLIFLIIIFTSLKSICSQGVDDLSNLVRDVVENEGVPSILWIKTCWSKIDEFKFAKNAPFLVQVVRSNNPIKLRIDANTNKQWFFIDINCEYKEKFLSTIEEKYFAHPYRWIIADATNDLIQKLPFLPDSNIILANKNENSHEYVLKQGIKRFKHLKNESKKVLKAKKNFFRFFSFQSI